MLACFNKDTLIIIIIISFISTAYKLSAICSLAHRIIHPSTNYEFITREFNKLSQLVLHNGYPSTLVNIYNSKKLFDNWYLQNDSRSVINPNRPINNVNVIIYFYQSQYYGNVSLYLFKHLKKLCNQYFKDSKLIFAYRSIRMHDFFGFKDRVPECLRSRMAYKFTFCRCNSTYVGMTNRHMRTRAYEHMGISPLTGANVKTT